MLNLMATRRLDPKGHPMPGHPMFRHGVPGDYVSFYKTEARPRLGTPGKRIVFCGTGYGNRYGKKRRRLRGDEDYEIKFPGAGEIKASTARPIAAGTHLEVVSAPARVVDVPVVAKPRKAAKRKAAARRAAPVSFSVTPRKPAKSRARARKAAAKPLRRFPARKVAAGAGGNPPPKLPPFAWDNYKVFVQTNKRLLARTDRGELVKPHKYIEDTWTMRKANRAIRQLGLKTSDGKYLRPVRISGKGSSFSGGRPAYHLSAMSSIYGSGGSRKRRRARLTRRWNLKGIADDKPTLAIGIAAGAGIAYAGHKYWWNKQDENTKLYPWSAKADKDGKVPEDGTLQKNPNEIYAAAVIVLGIGMTFLDKIKGIAAKPKLANGLKAAGIGLVAGSLGTFGWNKLQADKEPKPPTTQGRFRGRMRGRFGGLRGSENLAQLLAARTQNGRLGNWQNGSTPDRNNLVQYGITAGTLGVGGLGIHGLMGDPDSNVLRISGTDRASGGVVNLRPTYVGPRQPAVAADAPLGGGLFGAPLRGPNSGVVSNVKWSPTSPTLATSTLPNLVSGNVYPQVSQFGSSLGGGEPNSGVVNLLRGATEFQSSTQTGLSEAEYGL